VQRLVTHLELQLEVLGDLPGTLHDDSRRSPLRNGGVGEHGDWQSVVLQCSLERIVQ
jgi:hypothetical protein